MNNYSGEFAALLASLLWSISPVLFTKASHLTNSAVVNRIRLLAAFFYLLVTHWLLHLPLLGILEPYRIFWLGLSGILGLALGDALLFQSYILIGPRLSMLILSIAPIFTAIMGRIILNEKLMRIEVFAILMTLSGVGWVILEKNGRISQEHIARRRFREGLILAFGAAFTSSIGYVASKKGLQDNFSPITATLIRITAATIIIWVITIVAGKMKPTLKQLVENPGSIRFILAGAFVGPFLGVIFSLVAIQRTPVGIASTLMSLSPIFLIPLDYFIFKDRFGWQAILGTFIAIAGTALLFLV